MGGAEDDRRAGTEAKEEESEEVGDGAGDEMVTRWGRRRARAYLVVVAAAAQGWFLGNFNGGIGMNVMQSMKFIAWEAWEAARSRFSPNL